MPPLSVPRSHRAASTEWSTPSNVAPARMMARSDQLVGTNLAPRGQKSLLASGFGYIVQVRKLQMGIGIHEDVCVDDACYTSGPSDGVYRRDAELSRWALRNEDGWSTLPGWSFQVNGFERSWLQTFMNDVVGDQVMSTNIFQSVWYAAGNLAKYVGNGFCITFSQKYFNDMSSMISARRGGTA